MKSENVELIKKLLQQEITSLRLKKACSTCGEKMTEGEDEE